MASLVEKPETLASNLVIFVRDFDSAPVIDWQSVSASMVSHSSIDLLGRDIPNDEDAEVRKSMRLIRLRNPSHPKRSHLPLHQNLRRRKAVQRKRLLQSLQRPPSQGLLPRNVLTSQVAFHSDAIVTSDGVFLPLASNWFLHC